jgi:hypothetical protein
MLGDNIAGITGLLFALLYTGLEILTENPEATHSISIWHTPLIWFLASTLFYLVFYAVGTVRGGKVKSGDHQPECCQPSSLHYSNGIPCS